MDAVTARHIEGARLLTKFHVVADEFIRKKTPGDWKHVPCIIAITSFDQRNLDAARDAEAKADIGQREEKQLAVITLKDSVDGDIEERKHEILAALAAIPDAIVDDTFVDMGQHYDTGYVGVQLRSDLIDTLKNHPEFRLCEFKKLAVNDAAQLNHIRPLKAYAIN